MDNIESIIVAFLVGARNLSSRPQKVTAATPPKTNIFPVKRGQDSKGMNRLPSTIFQGQNARFGGRTFVEKRNVSSFTSDT